MNHMGNTRDSRTRSADSPPGPSLDALNKPLTSVTSCLRPTVTFTLERPAPFSATTCPEIEPERNARHGAGEGGDEGGLEPVAATSEAVVSSINV